MLLRQSRLVLVSLSVEFFVLELRSHLLHFSVAKTYKSNLAPAVGVAKVFGFDKYLFISSNACCYEGPHAKSLFAPFEGLKYWKASLY